MEFPGGSDNYLTISGSAHPFLSSSETFHTPSLGDEEFEIPPISLDPDTVSDVVSHFGELGEAGPAEGVAVPGNAVVEGDDPSFASTFVSAPSQVLEHLSLGVMGQPGGAALLGSSLGMDLGHPIGSQFGAASPVAIDVPLGVVDHGLLGSNQLTTIDQSELSAQLGLGLGGGNLLQGPPQSPQHPLAASVSPASSLQDDDMDDFRRSVLVESPLSLSAVSPSGVINLDPSPSESSLSGPPLLQRAPHKPVSAYALFFRDTQAAIKGQNPNATFGEVSKIVASMWDSLGEGQKQVYKRKNEAAKRDYLKALAEYKVSQISQVPTEDLDSAPSPPPVVPIVTAAPPCPAPVAPPPRATRSQQYNPEENTITNICTSNIILDLPQVTTRSRTGAIKPPLAAPPAPPTVAKIIIRQTPPGSSPRQPPPLQQMQSTPPPPRLQQMVHAQTPPPLQAKPRGAAQAPPPLQIKVVPSARRSDGGGPIIVTSATPTSSAMTVELRQAEGEDGAEEGMEVEVNVAPGPGSAPSPSSSSTMMCVRAGCSKPAVESNDWDKEYCSNECVATHCRDVFMAWCAIRGQSSTKVA